MEVFGAMAGLALCVLALAFLVNGFPSITINRYYSKDKKPKQWKEF